MTEEVQAALDDNMPPLDEAEQVVEAKEEVTPVEVTEESAPSPAEDTSEKPKEDGFQKRINKVTADKYAAERRADELERKLAEAQINIPAQTRATNEPKEEDFDYDSVAYNKALTDYQFDQKFNEREERQQQEQALRDKQALQQQFDVKRVAFQETVPDYAELVGSLPPLHNEVLDAIMLPKGPGPEMAYHLAKHLDIVDDLNSLPPSLALLKLGEITAKLLVKPELKTSAAPEPIEPVTASGSLNKSYDDMSMDEIMNL